MLKLKNIMKTIHQSKINVFFVLITIDFVLLTYNY